ncbi:MAG: DUF4347 domain-containing protein, partial [Magnetospirillum sp.]|nr:DUF4347 domain-containing protein [Magnetospirillum sp.]
AADPSLDGGKTEVVFVDTSIADYQHLVAAVKTGIEVELIDGNQDGLVQMAAWAGSHSGYDSISLLSHGSEGTVRAGSFVIDDYNISVPEIRARLAQVGAALKPGGDLLLYGCNVAEGADGQQFVNDLAAVTGRTVAASSHVVGSDGTWTLDDTTGTVTATLFKDSGFKGDLADSQYVLNEGTVVAGAILQDTYNGAPFSDEDVSGLPTGYTFGYINSANHQFYALSSGVFVNRGAVIALQTSTTCYNGYHEFTVHISAANTGTVSVDIVYGIIMTGGFTPTLSNPTIAANGLKTSTSVVIDGSSSSTDAGATITVYDNGSSIGTTTADSSGNWSYTANLAAGSHPITAKATETGYNASGLSNTANIIVDTGPTFTNANSVTVNNSSPFALTATVTDPASASITYSVSTAAGHGTAGINSSSGVISYTPTGGYLGYDTFVIRAVDGYNVASTQTITVLNDNPPTLTTTSSSPMYIVGNAPVVVDSGITLNDADTPSSIAAFGGGSLRAHLSNSDTANDSLSVVAQTLANSHVIAVTGNTITDNGTTIGTFTGGSNGTDLVVTFASGVTSTQATDIARAIEFSGGNTSSTALRTITFTASDGLGVSANGSDTARALLGPTILSATYDPATGNLVLNGGDFTTSTGDYTLSGLTLSGEGSGTYTLGNGDAITGTPTSTSVTIHIASANQASVDALFDRNGTTALTNGHAFNINAALNWDQHGTTHAPAVATNGVTVTSSGTPTLGNANSPAPGLASTDTTTVLTLESGSVLVADAPDLSGAGMWNGGTLSVAMAATNRDSAHDQLSIAASGGITVFGSVVSYNGNAFATLQGTATGTSLQFTLSGAAANDAAIAALAKAIRYQETGTTTGGDRTINFTVTDAYGRSSAPLAAVAHVYTPPAITGVAYDANTGLLSITGTNLTLNPTDFTLSKLTITGEGSGSYTLNNADSINSTSTTQLVIQIDPANQPTLDAILDKQGTTAAINTTHTFNLALAAGWDANVIVTEAVSATNTVTVSSSATPTLTTTGATTIYDTNVGSNPGTVITTSVTATDMALVTAWNTGNLTASVAAASGGVYDSNADQLTIAVTGGITTSGATAGSTVSYNGTVIGTIKSGATGIPGQNLTITLNASATSTAIGALVNAIQFSDSTATSTGNRAVSFRVTDAYGATSAALSNTVSVVPAPAITSTGAIAGGWSPLAALPSGTALGDEFFRVVPGQNGALYAAYNDAGNLGHVYKYANGAWTQLGATFSFQITDLEVAPTGAADAGTPYVMSAVGVNPTVYVDKYNATTSTWANALIGTSSFSPLSVVGNSCTITNFAIDTSSKLYFGGTYVSGSSWSVVAYEYSAYRSGYYILSSSAGFLWGLQSWAVMGKGDGLITYYGAIGQVAQQAAVNMGGYPTSYFYGTARVNSDAGSIPNLNMPDQDPSVTLSGGGSNYSGIASANGQYVFYASNYGSAGETSTVTDEGTGTSISGPPVASGGIPVGITVTPSGTLYAAVAYNSSSESIQIYRYTGSSWVAYGTAVSLAANTWSDLISDTNGNISLATVGSGSGSAPYTAQVYHYAAPGVFYDPYTANLTITGTNFTTNTTNTADYTLSKMTISGEGGVSAYTLGNGDAITSLSSTQIVIHIASANQASVDALLDAKGANAAVTTGNYFNLSAAQGWDTSGGIIAPAETINTINVTSTGTPTLTNSNPIAPVEVYNAPTPKVVDSSTITVTDQPDFSGNGVWASGSLTASITAGQDTSHDELLVGNVGAITNSGGTISYNGNLIGTVDGTANGTPSHALTINFAHNSYITDAAIQALVNAIQFTDTGTTTTGDRTISIVATDAYSRATTAVTDTVHVVTGPTISGATYDPYTGILTIQGGAFVGGTANVTLSSLGITGEAAGGTFTLSGANATVTNVTSSAVTIQISPATQQTLNAILDRNGLSAVTSGTFNLNAGVAWDSFGGVNAPAAATNVISVTSSGTPSFTHTLTTTTDTNFQSSLDTVDSSTVTVNDVNSGASAYFASSLGAWTNGNLTVSISGASADTAHDQLSIGAIGLITTSGATAGSTVSYNGHQIGTIATGAAGTPGQMLTIKLSGQYATNAAVQALVNAIQFSDSGTTNSLGNRTVTFTATDAYGKSASVTDTVTVVGVPAISGASYDPFTGILTITGTNFTTVAGNYTLANLTLSGEGSSTYSLGNGDAVTGTPTATSVQIQIASANQSAVDALFDKSGTTALVSTTHNFNVAALAGWDANGSVSAFAQATNTVSVASTGTPTLTNNSPTIASGTTIGSTAQFIDTSTITVTDAPDLSGSGMWAGGNLTVAFGATNRDTAHDMLSVGTGGGITVSGSNVSYNGTVIGTLQTGATGAPNQNLTIKFSGAAVNDAAIAALVNAIQFSDTATTTAGTRKLTFTLTDAYGRSSSGLAEKVYVTPDTPPAYVNGNGTQTVNTGRDTAVTISSATLSVSDTDANQNETWSASVAPSHGTLSFSMTNAGSGSTSIAGPVVTYTPAGGYVGSDTFTIQVSDGQGGVVAKMFNVNVIAPVIQSIVRVGSAAPTKATTDSFTVTFNETISGLSAANFSLGTTGSVTGTIGTPTSSDGGKTWSVAVTGVSGTGTLGLNLLSNLTSITDSYSLSPSSGYTDTASLYTIDNTAPVVTGVTLNAAAYKVGDTVTATITTDAYDGNGAYALSAGTIDGATLAGWTYNTGTHSGTATFTVTTALTDVLSGLVPLSVQVADVAGNVSTAYTTGVAGTIIDSHAPSAVALSNTVAPLAANGVVGTLTSTDASTGAESFTYAITGGADAAKFQVVGNTLQVANATTLVGNTSYTVTVRSTDLGGNSVTQTLTLTGARGPTASAGGTLTYNERSAAAVIDTGVTLVNATGAANMTGATISISSGFVAGDVLAFTSQNNITGSYNSGTGVLILSGADSFANYQAALRSVTFAAPSLYETATTPRTITWAGTDTNGTGGTATSTVSVVYVNASPTLSLTGTANASINTAAGASGGTALFTGANASTLEAGQSITGLTLAVSGLADVGAEQLRIGGTWVSLTSGASGTAGGIAYTVGTITGGATTVTLSKSDTAANWNTTITGLSYKDTAAGSSSVGARSFTLTKISDSGGTGAGGSPDTTLSNQAIVTLSANDTPVITVPGGQTINNAGANAITGVSVSDTIVGGAVTATVSAGHGTLGFTGAGITGNNSASVTISAASVSALNTILGTLNYTTSLTTSGADSITVSVNDNGGSYIGGAKSASGTIAVSVTNGTPVVNAPSSVTDTLSGQYAVTGISVAEALSGPSMTATLSDSRGNLHVTAGGATVGGNDSASVTITGTLAQLNTALASLKYTTTLTDTGADVISISVNDNGKNASGAVNVTVTGNDTPVLALATTQSFHDTNYHGLTGVAVTDTLGGASVTATLAATSGNLRVTAGSGVTVTGNGTGNVSISGSQGSVNAALGTLQYATTATSTANDTITVSYNDNGGNLVGGAKSASGTIAVSLIGNQPATITTPASQSYTDAVQHAISGLALADTYSNSSVTATVSDLHGNLNFTASGSASIGGNDSGSVTITGSLADVSSTLNSLKYTTTATGTTSDTISLSINDNGATANLIGGDKTASTSIAVSLTGNDIPVVTAPALQSFTDTNQHAISGAAVADTLSAASVTATVAAQSGNLNFTASGAAGIGSNNSGSVTITGTLADVNATLASLKYTTTATGTAGDTVTVSVNDNNTNGIGGAKTGSNSFQINLTGNDAPVVTVPGTQDISDLTAHALSGISLSDTYSGATVTATVSASVGTLTGTGFTGSGTGSMTITGTQANVNAALATVQYTAADDGSGGASADVVTVQVNDNNTSGVGGAKTTSRTVAITLINNDTPSIAVPAQQTINDTTTHAISGISVTDSLDGTSYVATVSDTAGILTMTTGSGGATISGSGSTSVTASGSTLADVNSALATLTYATTATSTGGETITVSINDNGSTKARITGDKTGTTTLDVALIGNDTPVLTMPATQTVTTSAANAISGIAVADTYSGSSLTATVSASHGTLSFTGSGVTGNNSASVSISAASVSALNTILGTLNYTTSLTASGSDSITVTVDDGGGSRIGGAKTATSSVAVNVVGNDTPVVNVATEQTISDTNAHALSGVGLTDGASGTTVTATVTAQHGNLTFTGGGVTGNGTGNVTISGTASAVNTILGTLQYTTTATATGSDTVSVTINDGATSLVGGAKSATNTFQIDLIGNDTPTLSLASAQGLSDTNAHALSGIGVTDGYSGGTVTATLQDTTGHLHVTTAAGLTVTANDTNSVSLSGTLSAINTALGTVTYSATTSGNDNITISVDDGGSTLIGGHKTTSGTVVVNVAGNDAPTITVPTTQTINDTAQHAIGGVVVSDTYHNTTVTTTVSALYGNLNVTNGGGAAVVTNNDTGTVTINGSFADVNIALSTIKYTTTRATAGSDDISIAFNDNGTTANLLGGSKSSTAYVFVAATKPPTGPATSGAPSVPLGGSGGIPGSTVTIRDGGTTVGTATVDNNGNWTFTAPAGEGSHSYTSQETDPHGKVGPQSIPLTTVVSLPKPPPPPPPPPPAPVVEAPKPPPPPTEAPVLVTSIRAAVSDAGAFNQGSQGGGDAVAAKVAALTTGGGFQVVVSTAAVNAVRDGALFVAKGIPTIDATSNAISFAVPADAFGHTNADAGIQLAAKMTDGRPLPPWVSFDPTKGTFVGEAPEGFKGTLSVVVVARDSSGHEVATTFRIRVGGGAAQDAAPTKPQAQGEAGERPSTGAPRQGDSGPALDGKPAKLGQRHGDKQVGKVAFTQQLKLASRNAAFARHATLAARAVRS